MGTVRGKTPLKKFRRGKRPLLAARDGLQNKEKILIHSNIHLLDAYHVQTQG